MAEFKRKHFLEGYRFERLTVEKYLGNSEYECVCDCGNKKSAFSSDLRKGKVKSCGCLGRERLLDIAGEKFGRLTVIQRTHKDKNNHYYFLCRCDCGQEKVIKGKDITAGKVKSCGKHNVEAVKEANTTHGETKTRLYNIHKSMKTRCYKTYDKAYRNYGGRGIKICDDWLGDNGYTNFRDWAHANGYQEDLSIDRIDVNGNYCPENCRWATNREQVNNRRNSLIVKLDGVKMPLTEWCEILDISYDSVWKRINKYNYSEEEALTKDLFKLSNYKAN